VSTENTHFARCDEEVEQKAMDLLQEVQRRLPGRSVLPGLAGAAFLTSWPGTLARTPSDNFSAYN